jgi:hypothetical protein
MTGRIDEIESDIPKIKEMGVNDINSNANFFQNLLVLLVTADR